MFAFGRLGRALAPLADSLSMEDAIKGKVLPGMIMLLSHPHAAVRAWAFKSSKDMGTIGVDQFSSIEPVFRKWYEVSEQQS